MDSKHVNLVLFSLLLMLLLPEVVMMTKAARESPPRMSTSSETRYVCITEYQCQLSCAERRLAGVCIEHTCTCVGGRFIPGLGGGGRVIGPGGHTYAGGIGGPLGGARGIAHAGPLGASAGGRAGALGGGVSGGIGIGPGH